MLEEAASKEPAGLKYSFSSTASFGQESAWWADNQPDLLVICLPEHPSDQQLFIDRMLAVLPKDIRLMLVTAEITPALLKLSSHFSDLRMLKGPVQGNAFFKAIDDFVTFANPEAKQKHQRHAVNIQSRIEVAGTGDVFNAVAKNISIGGAYVETESQSKVDPDDKISLTFFLGEMSKEYQLDARIIWVRPLSAGRGMALGVSFIAKQDLYDTLLANFKS